MLLRDVYARFKVDKSRIQYIEAHGNVLYLYRIIQDTIILSVATFLKSLTYLRFIINILELKH